MKTRIIELFEKQVVDVNINLIAECNEYDESGVRIQQLSRSPFTFPSTMTDDEIKSSIQINEYSIYFA